MLLVVAGIVYGVRSTWQHARTLVAASERYQLEPDQIVITDPPEWIMADVRSEVIRDAGLDHARMSILDEQLASRLASAFSFHHWVERVRRVEKRAGRGVHIDVVYRRPVAWVELNDAKSPRKSPRKSPSHLLIDSNHVRLPEGTIKADALERLPLLGGITSCPLIGSPWDDPHVVDGLRVVRALSRHWRELGLAKIIAQPPVPHASYRPQFYLETREGRRILWGSAPEDVDRPADIRAKVEKLRSDLQQEIGSNPKRDAPS